MKSIMFLGGDMRSVYAASKLNTCYDCYIYGFDKTQLSCSVPVVSEPFCCDMAVLPLPASTDGEHINAPYLPNAEIGFEAVARAVKSGGTVFTSKSFPALEAVCAENNLRLENYFDREEMVVLNAVPTAEGAVEIALRELPVTIFGTSVLITGCGRTARVLIKYLAAMGAVVTVAARKHEDLAWARIYGCRAVLMANAADGDFEKTLPEYDLIYNTVPAAIFDRERLALLKKDCLLIDIASKTCVGNFDVAKSSGVKIIWALSLPGKTAPVTAGHIIADTIENIIADNAAKEGSGENERTA